MSSEEQRQARFERMIRNTHTSASAKARSKKKTNPYRRHGRGVDFKQLINSKGLSNTRIDNLDDLQDTLTELDILR